jgi:hypothetical protein
VNGFAQKCGLKPEPNSSNGEPPEGGETDALGTCGNAHRCRCPKDGCHEAHEYEWGALLATCNNVVVKILDFEQVSNADETENKEVYE